MHITRPTKIIAVAVAGLTMGTAGIVAGAGSDAPDATPTGQSSTTADNTTATDDTTVDRRPADDEPAVEPDPAEDPAGEDPGADDTTGLTPPVTDVEPSGTSVDGPAGANDETDAGHAPADEPDRPDEPDEPDEPADEVDEPEAPGEPGEVHAGDMARSEPAPPPPPGAASELAGIPNDPPPPPTIPGPADFSTPLPGPHPEIDDLVPPEDPTPIDGPSDFQMTPAPSHLGDISSGLTGCQLDCVTSALLSANPSNPDVHLDVEATVPVHFEIEVTETGTNSSLMFNNPGYDTTYDFHVAPLEPDTTYDLTMIAIDQDGHSQVYAHRFTTVDIVDGFAGNAQGCALDCITEGVVDKTGDFSKVEIHLETNSPATMQVWLSTEEPTWVDDPGAKPAFGPILDSETPSTSWTFDVPDLDELTTYHVVAKAEDGFGTHYRVGQFTTDANPNVNVQVGFERIIVTHDGDKHALNRGEITFGWGFGNAGLGWRAEEKMHPGSFDIGGSNTQWFSVDADDGTVPNPVLNARERDADGLVEFCALGGGLDLAPVYRSHCDSKSNVAMFGYDLALADIEQFESCVAMGITTAGVGARCAAISTGAHGTNDDDYTRFIAYVSFFVA